MQTCCVHMPLSLLWTPLFASSSLNTFNITPYSPEASQTSPACVFQTVACIFCTLVSSEMSPPLSQTVRTFYLARFYFIGAHFPTSTQVVFNKPNHAGDVLVVRCERTGSPENNVPSVSNSFSVYLFYNFIFKLWVKFVATCLILGVSVILVFTEGS